MELSERAVWAAVQTGTRAGSGMRTAGSEMKAQLTEQLIGRMREKFAVRACATAVLCRG